MPNDSIIDISDAPEGFTANLQEYVDTISGIMETPPIEPEDYLYLAGDSAGLNLTNLLYNPDWGEEGLLEDMQQSFLDFINGELGMDLVLADVPTPEEMMTQMQSGFRSPPPTAEATTVEEVAADPTLTPAATTTETSIPDLFVTPTPPTVESPSTNVFTSPLPTAETNLMAAPTTTPEAAAEEIPTVEAPATPEIVDRIEPIPPTLLTPAAAEEALGETADITTDALPPPVVFLPGSSQALIPDVEGQFFLAAYPAPHVEYSELQDLMRAQSADPDGLIGKVLDTEMALISPEGEILYTFPAKNGGFNSGGPFPALYEDYAPNAHYNAALPIYTPENDLDLVAAQESLSVDGQEGYFQRLITPEYMREDIIGDRWGGYADEVNLPNGVRPPFLGIHPDGDSGIREGIDNSGGFDGQIGNIYSTVNDGSAACQAISLNTVPDDFGLYSELGTQHSLRGLNYAEAYAEIWKAIPPDQRPDEVLFFSSREELEQALNIELHGVESDLETGMEEIDPMMDAEDLGLGGEEQLGELASPDHFEVLAEAFTESFKTM